MKEHDHKKLVYDTYERIRKDDAFKAAEEIIKLQSALAAANDLKESRGRAIDQLQARVDILTSGNATMLRTAAVLQVENERLTLSRDGYYNEAAMAYEKRNQAIRERDTLAAFKASVMADRPDRVAYLIDRIEQCELDESDGHELVSILNGYAAKLVEAQKDAERGRWLISQMTHERCGPNLGWTISVLIPGDDPETAIDVAIAHSQPAQIKTLQDMGYAPGNYCSRCRECGQHMDFVDKRCRCCKQCAERLLTQSQPSEGNKP